MSELMPLTVAWMYDCVATTAIQTVTTVESIKSVQAIVPICFNFGSGDL